MTSVCVNFGIKKKFCIVGPAWNRTTFEKHFILSWTNFNDQTISDILGRILSHKSGHLFQRSRFSDQKDAYFYDCENFT